MGVIVHGGSGHGAQGLAISPLRFDHVAPELHVMDKDWAVNSGAGLRYQLADTYDEREAERSSNALLTN